MVTTASLPFLDLVEEKTPGREPWHRPFRSAWWDEHSEEVLENKYYQAASVALIVLNAIVCGLETDLPDLMAWDMMENGFLVYFTVDLFFRVYAVGPEKYFACTNNKELVWNIFDAAIVGFGVFDVVSASLSEGNPQSFVTVLRLFRLLRILRIFKVVRFLKPLYLLAQGFVEGVQAVVWVTALTAFVLYICAIILVKTYTRRVGQDDPDYELLSSRFNSIPQTMFTLFEVMSNPDLTAYHGLLHNNPALMVFFLSFVIFGSFGMIALLTGVISESMFEKNQAKIMEESMEREQKRAHLRDTFGALYDHIDHGNTRCLTREQLEPGKKYISKVFEDEGVCYSTAELDNLFVVLDSDGSGSIERDEFVNGTMQLASDVRPLSIMELHYQASETKLMIKRLEQSLVDVMNMLGDANCSARLRPLSPQRPQRANTDPRGLPVLPRRHEPKGMPWQQDGPDASSPRNHGGHELELSSLVPKLDMLRAESSAQPDALGERGAWSLFTGEVQKPGPNLEPPPGASASLSRRSDHSLPSIEATLQALPSWLSIGRMGPLASPRLLGGTALSARQLPLDRASSASLTPTGVTPTVATPTARSAVPEASRGAATNARQLPLDRASSASLAQAAEMPTARSAAGASNAGGGGAATVADSGGPLLSTPGSDDNSGSARWTRDHLDQISQ